MKKDITNLKFGRLTAMYVSGKSKSRECIWHCKCDCGNEIDVVGSSLRNGNTKSCGCWNKECPKPNTKKHGMTNTRIYNIWKSMNQRCYNKNAISYKHYGGRGIKVCSEWRGNDGFLNFYNWAINNGYSEELTIDRIDNDGNYEPLNCRWETNINQQNNKSNNTYIEYLGKTYTLAQLSKKYNINSDTLSQRIRNDWDLHDALTIPVKKGNNQTLKHK